MKNGYPKLTQGEIADRVTILEWKVLRDPGAADVSLELLDAWQGDDADLEQLRRINARGWTVVEEIQQHFDGIHVLPDAEIIEACRQAYLLNKIRVEIKNRINAKFDEPLEFKTWKPSTT